MNFLKDMSVPAIGLVFLITLMSSVQSCTHSDFKEVCDKSGGTTIFDGRQYQCLPPALVKSK
jgi:hypothetical protein